MDKETLQHKKEQNAADTQDKNRYDLTDTIEEEARIKTSVQISDFMQEQIKKRPLSRKKLTERFLLTGGFAAVFGIVACLFFVLLEPVFSNALFSQDSGQGVTIPADVREVEITPDEMKSEDEVAAEEASRTERQIENEVNKALSEKEISPEQYDKIYHSLQELARENMNSIVTVSVISEDADWWGQTEENSQKSFPGLIVAQTDARVLILCPANTLMEEGALRITFHDKSEYSAEIVASDTVTGYTVVAVAKNNFSEETRESIKTASLSSEAPEELTGRPVIAIGSPAGSPGSICYGAVTGTELLDLPDACYQRVTTDIYGSPSASGILLDMYGRTVGIIDSRYIPDDRPNCLTAVATDELREMIEKLSNGSSKAGLGIHGLDITENISTHNNLPMGIYVTSVEMDSPAMNAGIQAGDIIVSTNGTETLTMHQLASVLNQAEPGDTGNLKIMRQTSGAYEEMAVEITFGS
jgi:S1-C subfamily serine protease